MKKPLPELNYDEKLMLRCYLKNIITIGGLSDRMIKIMESTDLKILKRLISS
jgi:hypothetical protein|tara:strand:- start:99 stop:254 length:156 start_codon:yes stop_codon:yes gene_type:complete